MGAINVIVLQRVHVGVDPIGIETHVFHDVNLTTGRPTNAVETGAECPQRRPCSPACWNLGSNLDTTISPARLALRDHTRGSVLGILPCGSPIAAQSLRIVVGILESLFS